MQDGHSWCKLPESSKSFEADFGNKSQNLLVDLSVSCSFYSQIQLFELSTSVFLVLRKKDPMTCGLEDFFFTLQLAMKCNLEAYL